MAKLIRFPQVDERPTPPVAFGLDDDSNAWWAGAQRCFVAIPIAATLATVALSASLCWGAHQRNEEIVPQPAPTALAVEEWSPPIIQKQASWKRVWIANEPIALQPAVDDEQNWTKPLSIARPVRLSGPEWDDQVPAGSLFGQPDEDFWAVWTPPYATPKFVYLPDPEEIPSGSLFGVPEEDAWAPPVVSSALTPPPLVWVDEEIVPQAVSVSPEEDTWTHSVAQPQASWRRVWWADEQIVPQPDVFTFDDPLWEPVVTGRALWAEVWWADDEVVAPPVPLNLDEAEYGPVTGASLRRTTDPSVPFMAHSLDEDWVPGVSPAPGDTEVWHGRRRPSESRRKAWPLPPPQFAPEKAPEILTFGKTEQTEAEPHWITPRHTKPRGQYRGLVYRPPQTVEPAPPTPTSPLRVVVPPLPPALDSVRTPRHDQQEEELILALLMQGLL